jgi:hypothetical protein
MHPSFWTVSKLDSAVAMFIKGSTDTLDCCVSYYMLALFCLLSFIDMDLQSVYRNGLIVKQLIVLSI